MTETGFFRVAAVAPVVNVADCTANTRHMIDTAVQLDKKNVKVVVFPELSITGYTCEDLFHNAALLNASDSALISLAKASENLDIVMVVGAPVVVDAVIYNCGVVIGHGRIYAAVPKVYIPNYNEFYEKRWWTSGLGVDKSASVGEYSFPLTVSQMVSVDGVRIGIEICEDLWTPVPPSTYAAMAGADIIVNLSASNDLIGKYDHLLSLIKCQSARCICAYVYASAGFGESTTDLVFDGKAIIAENGSILSTGSRWSMTSVSSVMDIDIEAIRRDRMNTSSFNDCAVAEAKAYSVVHVSDDSHEPESGDLMRYVNPLPFVPAADNHLNEVVSIQVEGLSRRLSFTHTKSLVVGISGGLDSTLALLIACRTFDRLGIDRSNITGVTMPGFGTTDRTYTNAMTLMRKLGVSVREISIVPAVLQHFKDINHDVEQHDVTYENSQARERTQILMDIANQTNGMVLGTGDLSELALGWATYNGDHMSMYGVNAGVPKTLVQYLVRWFAANYEDLEVRDALLDVVETPISPELIPAEADGSIKQKTEDLVGPYELHDFFIYYMLRYGFSPRKIYFLAQKAFAGTFTDEVIKKWLRIFCRRFFMQQFKRSCLPDGPKIGSVSLSPRGDWRMPSDACADLWLAECDSL